VSDQWLALIAAVSQQLKNQFLLASPQIDFGNFLTGSATILLAIVTIFVALRSTKANSYQKIGEFRQQWIADLKNYVSDFVMIVSKLSNSCIGIHDGQSRINEIDFSSMNAEIRKFENLIILNLNEEEELHRVAKKLVNKIRILAESSSIVVGDNVEPKSSVYALDANINILIESLNDIFRMIFKTEWDKTRYEVKRTAFISVYIRSIWSKKKFKSRIEDASLRLDRIDNNVNRV
jgi:archaellum component FlaF (FlaF/FlaG flagellin family)